MSIETIIGAAQGASFPSSTANAEKVEVYEQDGKVLVNSSAGNTHVLADKHCYNCVTGFESLQSAARRGEDGGLFELAVEQTKQRQKALGVAAQPGGGPLRGLTETGRIREAETAREGGSAPEIIRESDSVSLSRTGMIRATGAEVASLGAAPVRTEPETSAESEVGGTTGAVDTEGAPIDGIKAVEPPRKADSHHGHNHGDEGADLESDSGKSAKDKHVDKLATELSDSEKRQVEEMQQRDAEVRAHEQAHKSAGGQHAGAISLSYETGPDGRKYAVAGEVPVDISRVSGDPRATLQKMQQIQRAALAPAEPSSADRQVAARAAQYATEARAEIIREDKEAPKKPGGGSAKESSEGQDGEETKAANGADAVGRAGEAAPDEQSDAAAGEPGGALVEPGAAPVDGGAESVDDGAPQGVSGEKAGAEGAAVKQSAVDQRRPSGAATDDARSQGGKAKRIAAYGRGARGYQFSQPATFNTTA